MYESFAKGSVENENYSEKSSVQEQVIKDVSISQKQIAKNRRRKETLIKTKEEMKLKFLQAVNQAMEEFPKETKEDIWEIEIKKINLKAPIGEGTTKETMDKFVGHFENTSVWEGNVGLAAHNRGCAVNYFGKIKNLKKGDEIIYRTPYGERIYEVNLMTIINDTNWHYLESTKENTITLITCVENKPKYRRCIQGVQKGLQVEPSKNLVISKERIIL